MLFRSGLVAIRYPGSPVGSLGQQNPDLTLWQVIRSGSRRVRVYEAKLGRHLAAQQLADQLCREHPEVSVSRLAQVHTGFCRDVLLRAGVPL